ncbi:MAG: glycerate kinase [Actinomycetota bacterium]
MRILVAPDKFRGTLTGRQAAEAIETGWRRERPGDRLDLVPLADGGEGTLEALVARDAGRRIRRSVIGPLGGTVEAEAGIRGSTGVVEMARASGLELLAAEHRDPLRATTRGTGELMAAVLAEGVSTLLVCLGGSATNDGGVGMASALGGRFLDASRHPITDGGAALVQLASIDVGPVLDVVRTVEVVALTDVDNPLCGPSGASAVFGPQKGASADDVLLLDRALGHLAAVAARDLGVDHSREAGAGAAGGLGYGLLAFTGARLRPGVEIVMEVVGFEQRIRAADLVITGEGSLDAQSLHGKVPSGVMEAARAAGVPVAILCGVASVQPEDAMVRSLVDRVGIDAALNDARRSLELLAQELALEIGR